MNPIAQLLIPQKCRCPTWWWAKPELGLRLVIFLGIQQEMLDVLSRILASGGCGCRPLIHQEWKYPFNYNRDLIFFLESEMCANLYPYLWDLVLCTQVCHAFPRTENSQQRYSSFMLLILCRIRYVPSSCMCFEYLGHYKFKRPEIWYIKHRIERKAFL